MKRPLVQIEGHCKKQKRCGKCSRTDRHSRIKPCAADAERVTGKHFPRVTTRGSVEAASAFSALVFHVDFPRVTTRGSVEAMLTVAGLTHSLFFPRVTTRGSVEAAVNFPC